MLIFCLNILSNIIWQSNIPICIPFSLLSWNCSHLGHQRPPEWWCHCNLPAFKQLDFSATFIWIDNGLFFKTLFTVGYIDATISISLSLSFQSPVSNYLWVLNFFRAQYQTPFNCFLWVLPLLFIFLISYFLLIYSIQFYIQKTVNIVNKFWGG